MRAIRVGLAVAMLAVVFDEGWADDGPIGKDFSALAQELRDDAKHPRYEAPFEPMAGVDVAAVTAQTTRVSVGMLFDPALVPAFKSTIDVSGGRPRLVVHVDFLPIVRPAVYAVEVELRAAGATPTRQLVTFQLTHPGATLRPTGTWVVWRTHRWIGKDTFTPITMPLAELSGRSRIGPLRVAQYDHARHGTGLVSGTLSLSGPEAIALGDDVRAPIVLSGDFPLGTTTGQIELRAPQLAAPVVIAYEVRTKLPGWYVVPIFLLAGFFGWFFRVYLKQREDASALRLQAAEVRRRLEAEAAGHPDDDQREVLTGAREALDAAMRGGKAATITDAVTKGDAAITAAAASRATFRSELLAEVRAQREVASRRWRLPPELPLGPVRDQLALAEEHALRDQLVDAHRARLAARAELATLQDAAFRWASHGVGAIDRIVVPESQGEWKARLDGIEAALVAVPKLDPSAPAKGEVLLPAIHAASEAIAAGLAPVATALRALAAQLGGALGRTAAAQEQAALIDRAVAIDPAVIDNGGQAAISAVAAAVAALPVALRAAIVALFPAADLTVVDAQLATGGYLAAISAARPAPMPTSHRADVADAERAPASSASRVAERRVNDAPAAGTSGVVVTIAPAPTPAIVVREADELRTLAWARRGRAALSLVLSTVGAYVLYRDSFVGTATEIGALAAVAFTTEFTFEHALEVIGKAAKPTPT